MSLEHKQLLCVTLVLKVNVDFIVPVGHSQHSKGVGAEPVSDLSP